MRTLLARMSGFLHVTCTPIPFGGSAIGIKMTAITRVMSLVWPVVFLAQGAVLVGESDHFLFCGDSQVH